MGALPPLVGVAVNVTGVPPVEQIDVEVEVMFTEGVTSGLTVIVMLLLVAGFPVAQGAALEVKITLTTSLLINVADV